MAKTLEDVIDRLKAEGDITRNTGTNSTRSVKELIAQGNESLVTTSATLTEIRTMYDTVQGDPASQGLDEERRREDVARQEKMLAALEGLSGTGSGGGKAKATGGGGLFGKLGGLAGGLAMGGGVLMGGLGILAAGGGYLLDKLQDLDGKKIRSNVKDLLGIKDDFGGIGNFFVEGGAFGAAMAGIGIGLGVFAIGGAAAGAAQMFQKEGWTQKIVDNVKTLLSLSDQVAEGSNVGLLFKGGAFGAAMTGIGIGLGVFGVGSAVAKAAEMFEVQGWAQKIVDNVKTLLGITDLLGGNGFTKLLGGVTEGGSFAFLMTGLGAGLAVFGAGSAVIAGVSKFQETDWAQKIVDNVKKLLEIPALPGIALDTAGFVAVMGGISAGLVAFALGKGASGAADAITKFTGKDPIGERVYKQVTSLLGILDDPRVTVENSAKFSQVMGDVGLALTKFGAGKFVGTLAGAGAALLEFFGASSPFDEIAKIADQAEELTTAGKALNSIGTSLQLFAGLQFKGTDFDFEEFAEDLKTAVPIIEQAVLGGEDGTFFKTKIQGLANNIGAYEQAAANIQQLKDVLSIPQSANASGGSGGNTIINNYYSGGGSGGGTTVVPIEAKPYPNNRDINLQADGP